MRRIILFTAFFLSILMGGLFSAHAGTLYGPPLLVPSGGALYCLVWNTTSQTVQVNIQVISSGVVVQDVNSTLSPKSMDEAIFGSQGGNLAACKFKTSTVSSIHASATLIDFNGTIVGFVEVK